MSIMIDVLDCIQCIPPYIRKYRTMENELDYHQTTDV